MLRSRILDCTGSEQLLALAKGPCVQTVYCLTIGQSKVQRISLGFITSAATKNRTTRTSCLDSNADAESTQLYVR